MAQSDLINIASNVRPDTLPVINDLSSKLNRFFGFNESKEPNIPSIMSSTVRSTYRLQSYVRSIDYNDIKKAVSGKSLEIQKGKPIRIEDYVLVGTSDEDLVKIKDHYVINLHIINSKVNPLVILAVHKSWEQLVSYAMYYINNIPDYYSFITDDSVLRSIITIDSTDIIVAFGTALAFFFNVYGNNKTKVNFVIHD